ncbi:MAG: phytanoyl-CoA dioxygenase family protein [Actinomycetota bacterium]
MDSVDVRERFRREGYVGGVTVIDASTAAEHRRRMEWAESRIGPLHYRDKVHTILQSPLELATHPRLLDAVEALIGPDILLYNAMYIVKEPGSAGHIDWHQDLTYWGLSEEAVDGQVSAWLALSPATEQSGCMAMVPGSHLTGAVEHAASDDDSNLLHHNQRVAGVDTAAARLCPLEPGEASLHHGWTLHASRPNRSDDRRIGVNVQFIAPQVRQTLHDHDTVMLVRGEDRYGHFGTDIGAAGDLEPDALERQAAYQALIKGTYDDALS